MTILSHKFEVNLLLGVTTDVSYLLPLIVFVHECELLYFSKTNIKTYVYEYLQSSNAEISVEAFIDTRDNKYQPRALAK